MFAEEPREEAAAIADQHSDHGPIDGHHDDHGAPHDDEPDNHHGKKTWLAACGKLLWDAILLAVKLAIALEILGVINIGKEAAKQWWGLP